MCIPVYYEIRQGENQEARCIPPVSSSGVQTTGSELNANVTRATSIYNMTTFLAIINDFIHPQGLSRMTYIPTVIFSFYRR